MFFLISFSYSLSRKKKWLHFVVVGYLVWYCNCRDKKHVCFLLNKCINLSMLNALTHSHHAINRLVSPLEFFMANRCLIRRKKQCTSQIYYINNAILNATLILGHNWVCQLSFSTDSWHHKMFKDKMEQAN